LAMISMYADGNNTTRVVNEVLGMNQLTWQGWLITIGIAASVIPAVEFAKLLKIN
jgi:hypothetical protein